MAELTLVLGGVRSGKSRFAEQLAARQPPVAYLACAVPGDEEMRLRIKRHQQRRPPDWTTIECPWDVPGTLERAGGGGTVLVECVTLWLSNLMLGMPERPALDDAAIHQKIEHLIEAALNTHARVVVVSNEVGAGIIPATELSRRYCDLLGESNQRLAAAATEVHLCVAGLPVRIK